MQMIDHYDLGKERQEGIINIKWKEKGGWEPPKSLRSLQYMHYAGMNISFDALRFLS